MSDSSNASVAQSLFETPISEQTQAGALDLWSDISFAQEKSDSR